MAEIEFNLEVNDFSQLCLHNEILIKTRDTEALLSFLISEYMDVC